MNINQTLKGAIAEYLEHVTSAKSESCQVIEPIFFADLERYFVKINLLSELTPKDCDFFQTHLLKNKSPSTVNRQFTTYNHFFKKCIEWGYLQVSPTRFVKKKKEAVPIRILFTDEEISKICDYMDDGDWLKDAILFLHKNGGCRPDELGKIKVKDIFKLNEIAVERQHFKESELNQRVVVIECKKNSGEFRFFLVNSAGVEILERLSVGKSPDDIVFQNGTGRSFYTANANQRLARIQKALRLQRKPIYSLRHTYATKLCNKDINLEKVRLLLGHKKIQTTMKYLRVEILELSDVVESVS